MAKKRKTEWPYVDEKGNYLPMPIDDMLKHFNPDVLKAVADPESTIKVKKDRIIIRYRIKDDG